VARNLDMTALRSFVMVADAGGVTKAVGLLNLTQSAASMQLKRLEESLNLAPLDRFTRQISVTPEGEQLLSYARRMLALNDEALRRLTAENYEGEISLGVPHDIIYAYIPSVLRRFAADFPRMKIKLVSSPTKTLREMFGRGEIDAIVTTELHPGPGGESLVRLPLVWVGAVDGIAWRNRPLPVAFCKNCIFRSGVLKRLDQAQFDWQMVVESDLDNAVDAVVSADLAVHALIKGVYPRQTAPVPHDGALPDPGKTQIVLYMQAKDDPVQAALHDMIRHSYLSEWAGADVERRSA
jgi:DNA-binding transcriptional LysR family regulator